MLLEWKVVSNVIDWTKPMKQTFEYYKVDPISLKDIERIDSIISSSIDRDGDKKTLGSSTYTLTDEIGECYVRIYLIAIQNGVSYKIPLCTHLLQSPSKTFDGHTKSFDSSGYASLIELTEKQPPIGYFIDKGENILKTAYSIIRDNIRVPVVGGSSDKILYSSFVTNIDDDWLTFLSDLLLNAKYEFDVDELGRILFAPIQEMSTLSPIWTYTDDNSSILYPEITVEKDMYQIPNVVEVYYSSNLGSYQSVVINDDPNSPTSTVSRDRQIVYRDTNPDLTGIASKEEVDEYATRLLKNMSTLEYKLTYSHGYCPVRVNDCVLLNYTRAGINNVKAKVIQQSIECKAGCKVTETAIYTKELWG